MSTHEAGMTASQVEAFTWLFRGNADTDEVVVCIHNRLDVQVAAVFGQLFDVLLSETSRSGIVDFCD